jgi:hypothetical protein
MDDIDGYPWRMLATCLGVIEVCPHTLDLALIRGPLFTIEGVENHLRINRVEYWLMRGPMYRIESGWSAYEPGSSRDRNPDFTLVRADNVRRQATKSAYRRAAEVIEDQLTRSLPVLDSTYARWTAFSIEQEINDCKDEIFRLRFQREDTVTEKEYLETLLGRLSDARKAARNLLASERRQRRAGWEGVRGSRAAGVRAPGSTPSAPSAPTTVATGRARPTAPSSPRAGRQRVAVLTDENWQTSMAKRTWAGQKTDVWIEARPDGGFRTIYGRANARANAFLAEPFASLTEALAWANRARAGIRGPGYELDEDGDILSSTPPSVMRTWNLPST